MRPSIEEILTVRESWAALLRVAAVLFLCLASFEVGRIWSRLERSAAIEVQTVYIERQKSPVDKGNGLALGAPAGESEDKITPLNARDPSSLVMGPSGTMPPAELESVPSPPSRKPKKRPEHSETPDDPRLPPPSHF